jgi:hypothetical protein
MPLKARPPGERWRPGPGSSLPRSRPVDWDLPLSAINRARQESQSLEPRAGHRVPPIPLGVCSKQ